MVVGGYTQQQEESPNLSVDPDYQRTLALRAWPRGGAEGPSLLGFLPSLLESVLTALLVLVIFMLIERGVLRDRLLAFGGMAA